MNDDAEARIQLIKAHALNTLADRPLDVTSHDRLFLIEEIEKLRRMVGELEDQLEKAQPDDWK